jgi:hypothetical protein
MPRRRTDLTGLQRIFVLGKDTQLMRVLISGLNLRQRRRMAVHGRQMQPFKRTAVARLEV